MHLHLEINLKTFHWNLLLTRPPPPPKGWGGEKGGGVAAGGNFSNSTEEVIERVIESNASPTTVNEAVQAALR